MNIYEQIPTFEGENFSLRGLLPTDAEELLNFQTNLSEEGREKDFRITMF